MKETPLSNPFQSTSASDGQPGGRYKKPNANARWVYYLELT